MLQRSRFAHHYGRGEEFAIFHALTGEVVFGDRALLELFHSFPSPNDAPAEDSKTLVASDSAIVTELRAKGLLTRDGQGDEDLLKELSRGFHKNLEQPIWQMYILPTSQCNLACSYCLVDTSTNCPQMTPAIARQAVRYFLRHSEGEPKPRIFFYGGEPLLNKPAVFAAANEARGLESSGSPTRRINLSLITNGFAMDRATAEELKGHEVSVSVSIDGPAIVHDAYRKTRDGRSTFQRAVGAVGLLRDAGINPGVSVTITPTALQHWDEVVGFLIDTLKVKSVDFNVLLPGPGCPNEYVAPHMAPAEALLRAHARFRIEGIYEDRVMRRVKSFTKRKFRFTDCPGVGQQIAVAPDGSLGPCQGLLGSHEYFPLHVERDIDRSPFEHPLFAEWTKRTPLNFSECHDCPAIAICGGGCPLAPLRDRGSIWEVDQRACEQVTPIHEWLVWQLRDNKLVIDA